VIHGKNGPRGDDDVATARHISSIVVTDAATTTAATVLFNSVNASRQDRSPTAQRRIVTAPTMTNTAPKSTSGPSHQSI
jgi:hypothetical protein